MEGEPEGGHPEPVRCQEVHEPRDHHRVAVSGLGAAQGQLGGDTGRGREGGRRAEERLRDPAESQMITTSWKPSVVRKPVSGRHT